MLTRLDLQFEHDPFSNAFATRIRSDQALPRGVSLPALKAASFTGGQKVGVDMQAADIAAFAPRLQQLSVGTLIIKPAGATPGQGGQGPWSWASSSSGPSVLSSCTHLAATMVIVQDITSDQQFAPAFAAALPALEVVALLPGFHY